MRVHLEDGGKILGFYPEEIEYPVLPDSLVEITNEQYQDVLAANHTHLDENGNGYTPPAPEVVNLSRLSLEDKLKNLGFTDIEIATLLGSTA